MRFGGTGQFTIDYSNLKPVVAPADPPSVAIRVHKPDGTFIDVAAIDIIHDATGVYHYTPPPFNLDGTWRLVAQATGFPEVRVDVPVEVSSW